MHFYVLIVEMLRCVDVEVVYRLRQSRRLPPAFIAGQHLRWRCSFCDRDKQYLAGRGIERAAEEISRAFPHFPVIISAGDVIKDRIEHKPALVLATSGAQPQVEGGYSAVVILTECDSSPK